jgi:hypothetical protein
LPLALFVAASDFNPVMHLFNKIGLLLKKKKKKSCYALQHYFIVSSMDYWQHVLGDSLKV